MPLVRYFRKLLFLIAILCVARGVHAQTPPAAQAPQLQAPLTPAQPTPPQPPPRNPAATPEYDKLRFLLGFWEEEVDYSGAESGQGRGRWFARLVLGLHIQMDYSSGGPQGNYRATAVITWDKYEKVYRMWWLDDVGAIGEYRGKFSDENTLLFEHQGKVEGRNFREVITYKRVSSTEVHTKIEQGWDGGDLKPYLDAVAYRRGDTPPRPQPQGQPAQQPPRPPQQPPVAPLQ